MSFSLDGRLKLDARDFLRGTDKAQRGVQEIGDEFGKLPDDARRAADESSRHIEGIGDAVAGIGGPVGDLAGQFGALATPGGAIALIGGGLIAAGNHAADAAISVENLARLTGDSVEQASRLQGVWQQAGFDANDLQDVMLQMQGVLADDADMAARLGINLADGKTAGERFLQVVGKLGDEFPNAAERSVAASKLFGEEGVRQVNAVEGAYGDLSAAVDEYSGKVFTDEDVADAREYKKALGEVKSELSEIAAEIGSEVVPVMGDFLDQLGETSGWLERNTGSSIGESIGRGARIALFGYSAMFDDAQERSTEWATAVVEDIASTEQAAIEAGRVVLQTALETARTQDMFGTSAANARAQFEAATKVAEGFGKTGDRQLRKVGRAADFASGRVRKIRDEFAKLTGDLDDEQALLSLQEQFDETGEVAEAAFAKARDGADLAAVSTREERQAVLDLKQSVIDYAAQVGSLPESVVIKLLADIDQGKVAEVESFLARWGNGVTVPIRPQVVTTSRGTNIRIDSGGNVAHAPGATGAIVTRPTRALVGEAGPEAVIPLNRMPGASPLPRMVEAMPTMSIPNATSGGRTINLTVNAGVGADGFAIGQQVVEWIGTFERTNGPGWRAA